VITFLNPAVAVLLGVLLLDEPFTLGLALGLPLVVLGCVLATRRGPARQAVPVPDADAAEPADGTVPTTPRS
jgi:drug/metabolite transporter (DMT)-like permease